MARKQYWIVASVLALALGASEGRAAGEDGNSRQDAKPRKTLEKGTARPAGGCRTAGTGIGGALGAITGAAIGDSKDQASVRAARAEANAQAVAAQSQALALGLTDIAQLSQQGITDSVIINQIRITGLVYHLSSQDIIWLKQNMVSDAIIREMQATASLVPVARRIYQHASAHTDDVRQDEAQSSPAEGQETQVSCQVEYAPQESAPVKVGDIMYLGNTLIKRMPPVLRSKPFADETTTIRTLKKGNDTRLEVCTEGDTRFISQGLSVPTRAGTVRLEAQEGHVVVHGPRFRAVVDQIRVERKTACSVGCRGRREPEEVFAISKTSTGQVEVVIHP
jgi:hypothetical protein